MAYDPKKRILGYRVCRPSIQADDQDIDAVKSFVLAVVDQFLKRHGFVNKQEGVRGVAQSPHRSGSRAARDSQRVATLGRSSILPRNTRLHPQSTSVPEVDNPNRSQARPEPSDARMLSPTPPLQSVSRKRPALSAIDNLPGHMMTPTPRNRFEDSGLAGDEGSRGRLTVESTVKRHKWIENIVKVRPKSRSLLTS